MATHYTPRFSPPNPNEIDPATRTRRHEARSTVAALALVGVMGAGLFAVPFFAFHQTVAPTSVQSALYAPPAQDSPPADPAASPDLPPPGDPSSPAQGMAATCDLPTRQDTSAPGVVSQPRWQDPGDQTVYGHPALPDPNEQGTSDFPHGWKDPNDQGTSDRERWQNGNQADQPGQPDPNDQGTSDKAARQNSPDQGLSTPPSPRPASPDQAAPDLGTRPAP
jgi:hypothetical protein